MANRLIIKVKNGQPFEHPMLEENFVQCFPDVDVDNLPSEYAYFVRSDPPNLDTYETYVGVEYVLQDDGSYADVHTKRAMTDDEKLEAQNAEKTRWANDVGYSSWVFNEDTCLFDPPTPRPVPTDPNTYYDWDESSISWVLRTVE